MKTDALNPSTTKIKTQSPNKELHPIGILTKLDEGCVSSVAFLPEFSLLGKDFFPLLWRVACETAPSHPSLSHSGRALCDHLLGREDRPRLASNQLNRTGPRTLTPQTRSQTLACGCSRHLSWTVHPGRRGSCTMMKSWRDPHSKGTGL
jgi:hypothetical protein